jgi:hypothetical protein
MQTACTRKYDSFQALGNWEIVAEFNKGTITSDGGSLLLREVEQRTAILSRFAGSFIDYRDKKRIEHSALFLVSQRVIGLALGYEDLNDHDRLAKDPAVFFISGLYPYSGTTPSWSGGYGAGKNPMRFTIMLRLFKIGAKIRIV